MADGIMSQFYDSDKDKLYEIADDQARSDIDDLDNAKVDKVAGKGLSTNDYTTEEKTKLVGIEEKAQHNNTFFFRATSAVVVDNYLCYIMQGQVMRGNGHELQDGDKIVVDFNGIDASQLTLPNLYQVRFYFNESPSSAWTTEPHIVKWISTDNTLQTTDLLRFWRPKAIRSFIYQHPVGGAYVGLVLQVNNASAIDHSTGVSWKVGEVALSDALDDQSNFKAATTYAVKRLKDMIDALGGGGLTYEIVQTLPLPGAIDTATIYLVPKQTAGTNDVYEEYLNPTGTAQGWELIGSTDVDLSNYYDKSEVDDLLDDKADTSSLAAVALSNNYSDLNNLPVLGAVATSNLYDDLDNLPNLAQVATTGDSIDVAYSGYATGNNVKDAIDDVALDLLSKQDTMIAGSNTTIRDGHIIDVSLRDIKVNGNTVISASDSSPVLLKSGTGIEMTTSSNEITISKTTPDNYAAIKTSGSASAISGSWHDSYSWSFPYKGKWLVQASLTWDSNATGYRMAGINTSIAQPPASQVVRLAPANGNQTTANLCVPLDVTSTTQIYHLLSYHNVGTAGSTTLTVYPRLTYIRLCE